MCNRLRCAARDRNRVGVPNAGQVRRDEDLAPIWGPGGSSKFGVLVEIFDAVLSVSDAFPGYTRRLWCWCLMRRARCKHHYGNEQDVATTNQQHGTSR